MIERAKEEHRREKERAESSESDSEVRSGGESLETYISPSESKDNSERSSAKH